MDLRWSRAFTKCSICEGTTALVKKSIKLALHGITSFLISKTWSHIQIRLDTNYTQSNQGQVGLIPGGFIFNMSVVLLFKLNQMTAARKTFTQHGGLGVRANHELQHPWFASRTFHSASLFPLIFCHFSTIATKKGPKNKTKTEPSVTYFIISPLSETGIAD